MDASAVFVDIKHEAIAKNCSNSLKEALFQHFVSKVVSYPWLLTADGSKTVCFHPLTSSARWQRGDFQLSQKCQGRSIEFQKLWKSNMNSFHNPSPQVQVWYPSSCVAQISAALLSPCFLLA
nr:hypothetical protein Iba_chr14dCG7570 [Ipomoea batatas]